jgi:hypothetical protein
MGNLLSVGCHAATKPIAQHIWKCRIAICAIAGVYLAGHLPLACRYRLCSQPAFPADQTTVQFRDEDGARRASA